MLTLIRTSTELLDSEVIKHTATLTDKPIRSGATYLDDDGVPPDPSAFLESAAAIQLPSNDLAEIDRIQDHWRRRVDTDPTILNLLEDALKFLDMIAHCATPPAVPSAQFLARTLDRFHPRHAAITIRALAATAAKHDPIVTVLNDAPFTVAREAVVAGMLAPGHLRVIHADRPGAVQHFTTGPLGERLPET